jgi:hypothetical protein
LAKVDSPDNPDIPGNGGISNNNSKGAATGGNYGKSPLAQKLWEAVNQDILAWPSATDRDFNHIVYTGPDIIVPAFVLATLQSRGGVLMMHTGEGVTFSISYGDIPNGVGKDFTIDLSVKKDGPDTDISAQLLEEMLKGSLLSRRIPMTSHESFGMVVNQHYNVGAENAGNYANLYRYNKETVTFDYLGSYLINEEGQAMFGSTGGGDYLLTVTAERPDGKIAISNIHIVKPGDALSRIARRNNTTVARLIELNPWILNIDRIMPAQQIRIK